MSPPITAGWLADVPPRKWHLLLAGVCIAAVYLVGVTGQWWPTYLGLGRSLAEAEGYRFNGSVHNIVTPGLPLILAGTDNPLSCSSVSSPSGQEGTDNYTEAC